MSKHKLLLADDSITIQKVVNLTFADEGIEVISVGDGNSAMEKFTEETPDLVMADINMPGLSGYEICERIKGSEATRRIPVILLVGSFEPFDENEARRVGANDYLTKPFQSIRQLVSKVSDLLNAPPESDEEPANSFEDTLRMNESEMTDSGNLQDVGTDDDMIQAYQVGSSAYDETPKFETHAEPEYEDYGKTQPLSADEISEINSYQTHDEEPVENNYSYIADAEDAEQEPSINQEAETRDLPQSFEEENNFSTQSNDFQLSSMPGAASIPELDEMDLLELPPHESFTGGFSSSQSHATVKETSAPEAENVETQDKSAALIEEKSADDQNQSEESPVDEINQNEESRIEENAVNRTEESTVSIGAAQSSNLSPEVIDAIASKVVEKISDKVIREIAWEVVPQMTDLIVKRLAEEKLKE